MPRNLIESTQCIVETLPRKTEHLKDGQEHIKSYFEKTSSDLREIVKQRLSGF